MKKLWEGRFTKNTNALLEKFNASITFDKRMYAEDIKGSIAHSKMLSKQEIISQEDQLKIEKGLNLSENLGRINHISKYHIPTAFRSNLNF